MRKLILFIYLISLQMYSQNHDIKRKENVKNEKEVYSFFIRIPNKNNAPIILSKTSNSIFLKHRNSKAKSIFKKYKIYDFIQAFPNSKEQSLKETYLIKTNDPKLIKELRKELPEIYTFSEQIKEEAIPLASNSYYNNPPHVPNDYGFEIAQTDLDLINAQEAWDYTTGNFSIKLGIVDTEFNTSHPEFLGTLTATGSNGSFHGTAVAMNLAGNTNNNEGLASIGYNCYIEARTGLSIFNVDLLHQQGVKVINGSWANSSSPIQTFQNDINDIYNNGTTLVFAAGNITYGSNSKPIYPAAYDNVISVTSVHHKDFMQPAYDENGNFIGDVLRKKDTHDNSWVYKQRKDGSHNHTYAVDIAAPGYDVPTINSSNNYSTANGTSHAAPMVTGTIGLMLSVNSSISPLEIETILKLTSANIYDIPENANYIDKLGAGRLDAGKAVKMAYNMAQPTGVVEVKGRDFYRDWLYKLENAPYNIEIENQIFRDTIQVNFTARNSIEIQNATLAPNSIGFTELSIDPTIPLPTSSKTAIKKKPIAYINTTIFDNKEFTLKYFVKDGVKEDLILTNPNDPSGNTSRGVPKIEFTLDKISNLLDAGLLGYCNGSNAKYKIHENYLEVIKRGGTTLSDCGIDESTEYFNPITGNIYMQQPAKKVYYEFTEDNTGVWLWKDENHKLFFESKTLNTSNELLGNAINIYPNPTNDFINIVLKNNFYNINKVTIYDVLGTEIKTLYNKTKFNISELNSGVYLVKITSKNSLFTIKKIVKN